MYVFIVENEVTWRNPKKKNQKNFFIVTKSLNP